MDPRNEDCAGAMAQRLTAACAVPGCPQMATSGGKCAQHAKRTDAVRGTAATRGYDSDWQRYRAWFLRHPEHVICADCRHALSTEVHHVQKLRDRPDLRLDPTNTVGLCRKCHQAKTRQGL